MSGFGVRYYPDASFYRGSFRDNRRNGYGVEIKAVSYHMLEILEGPPAKIVVVLDL